MLFKKCSECKREYTKAELKEIQTKQKASKEKLPKNACPYCRKPLMTYDESRFQKKWYGYLNNDKKIIENLVLVEFRYYIDQYNNDFFEVKIPLLKYSFETKDFSEAINIPDVNISTYLKDKYERTYDGEHKFLTAAFKEETITEKENVTVWW